MGGKIRAMTMLNPRQSQAKRGERSTEAVIVRASRPIPAPCGHGMPRSLMTLKERKLWEVRTMGTSFLALWLESARNCERRPEVALRLLMWTMKGHAVHLSCSFPRLWVLIASPLHSCSQQIPAKASPHPVVTHHPLFPGLRTYLERSPLFAPLLTI